MTERKDTSKLINEIKSLLRAEMHNCRVDRLVDGYMRSGNDDAFG